MQPPVGLMCYHANACGLDALSCKGLWACCVIMQTTVGLICVIMQTTVGLICVIMQTTVGLLCYRAKACELDAL